MKKILLFFIVFFNFAILLAETKICYGVTYYNAMKCCEKKEMLLETIDQLLAWGSSEFHDSFGCFWSREGQPIVPHTGKACTNDKIARFNARCDSSTHVVPTSKKICRGVTYSKAIKCCKDDGMVLQTINQLTTWGSSEFHDSFSCFWSREGQPIVAHTGKACTNDKHARFYARCEGAPNLRKAVQTQTTKSHFSNNLQWSNRSTYQMDRNAAKNYCQYLSENGYNDWHLPTISELRTLIKSCSGTVTGGSCGVTDSCLSSSCQGRSCYSCGYYEDGRYSKFGETGYFWSSSVPSDDFTSSWYVDFGSGFVGASLEGYYGYVRCVR